MSDDQCQECGIEMMTYNEIKLGFCYACLQWSVNDFDEEYEGKNDTKTS